jgi:(p)ppGpp synthase/HD superfamily hydrolase
MIEKCRKYATFCHSLINQKRKYTGEDYITHPATVVSYLKTLSGVTDEMICAAWLHDVIEDVKIDGLDHKKNILALSNQTVVEYVEWLTEVSKPSDGNRSQRKFLDNQYIAMSPHQVKTIKLCDIYHNLQSIVENDQDFARIYVKEKKTQVELLADGNSIIWRRCYHFLQQSYKKLDMTFD